MKVIKLFIVLSILALSGCMPDRVGVSFGEQRLQPLDAKWQGCVIHLGWDIDNE